MAKVIATVPNKTTDPSQFSLYASRLLSDIVTQLNGNLTFGSNMFGQVVQVTFSSANTDTAVNHGLNKTGLRYFAIQKSAATDIYDGQTTSNARTIYLRSTVATNVTLILL